MPDSINHLDWLGLLLNTILYITYAYIKCKLIKILILVINIIIKTWSLPQQGAVVGWIRFTTGAPRPKMATMRGRGISTGTLGMTGWLDALSLVRLPRSCVGFVGINDPIDQLRIVGDFIIGRMFSLSSKTSYRCC